MTKFNYSEVQGVFTSSQSDRVACLANFSMVEATVSEFSATGALTGPGWDSAKQALAPYAIVTKALYNYHCDFGETYTAFLADFEGEVGETGKTLNTEELRQLQDKLNHIQQEKQDLLEKIAGNIALEILGGYGVMAKDFQLNSTKKEIELLEKYETFENAHAGDFTAIVSTGGDVAAALNDLGKSKSFNAKTGTYTYSDLTTKNWYARLTKYNEDSPSQRIEIVKTDKYGYGLKVYLNGKYSEQASANLIYAQSKEGMKKLGIALTNMAGEMTGMYSLYRLFTGTDPVTGSKVSRLEAGLWVALLLLPQAKMVEAVKTLRAGDRALAGADLTEADLMILSKAGYFDDVAKINKIEKASGAKSSGEDIFNYTNKVNEHMANPDRAVPAQTLKEAIKGGTPMPDPRGSSATMYYSEIYINGKKYNFEVLYDKATNTIYHFKYDRRPLGPLPAVPKQ
ncbi:pre-toxin TG domain-containing protein [Enterococcus sp. AZ101]|uniref:pre-toxin TG domain-containing protein n=1 Tax=Enterococcus sp. AZ101 TaxID=2774742 RepID=UPI003D28C181